MSEETKTPVGADATTPVEAGAPDGPSNFQPFLDPEREDLLRQLKALAEQAAKADDRLQEEHRKRIQERSLYESTRLELHQTIESLRIRLDEAHTQQRQSARRRYATIPKFVITAAAAFVLLIVPITLQKLFIIGPQLSFVIQALLMMVMSFCYAIIWDRSRK